MPTKLEEILPYHYRIVKALPFTTEIGTTLEMQFGTRPLELRFRKPKEGADTITCANRSNGFIVRVERGAMCTWAGPYPFKLTDHGFYEFVLHAEPRSSRTVCGTIHIVCRPLNDDERICLHPVIFDAYVMGGSGEMASDELFTLEHYYDTVTNEDDPTEWTGSEFG
ncbi:hypothetical protein [uncultured Xylophilus sp.]|uniref:hypothetical protein n=1 Tax=uncultured Xylophilus sp. TaxID=296832 RepID=UPI0025DAC685|nr:hypothetical protein [uncultured Xylophilus sp.]